MNPLQIEPLIGILGPEIWRIGIPHTLAPLRIDLNLIPNVTTLPSV
jgi:hypothetical protein